MIEVIVEAKFVDNDRSPHWMAGESFNYRGFLPAVPPIGGQVSGVLDHDRRSFNVKVRHVEMTVDSAVVLVFGAVV